MQINLKTCTSVKDSNSKKSVQNEESSFDQSCVVSIQKLDAIGSTVNNHQCRCEPFE